MKIFGSLSKEVAFDLLKLTFGHHKGRNGRGSQGRADGIALLGCVDPAVPAAPGFSRGKHATTTTHLHRVGLRFNN